MCGRKTTVAEYSVVKELIRRPAAGFWLWALTLMSNPWCAFELERLDDARLTASNRLRFDAAERWSAPPASAGGEYRARTGDLLVANQALSQLS